MANPYATMNSDNVRYLPGCAFWIDGTGVVYLGFTEGGAALTVNPNAQEVMADEAGGAPIAVKTGGTRASMKITGLETVLTKIARMVGYTHYAAGDLNLGDVPGKTLTPGAIVHRPFAHPDGSQDLILRQAVCTSELTFTHKHDEPMKIDLDFVGVVDESKADTNLLNGGIGYRA